PPHFLSLGFRFPPPSHLPSVFIFVSPISPSLSLWVSGLLEKMAKQGRSRKSEAVGKGKVTPIQVAFLVDRYLCENNFSETRAVFRNEAASLISKSPVNEAPKSLLGLGMILNDYISLKEQKVMLDQERVCLEQEKIRVQNLLNGMQQVMNVYNGTSPAVPSAVPLIQQASATKQVAVIPQPPQDGNTIKSPNMVPIPTTASNVVANLPATRKRGGSATNRVLKAPNASKKAKLLSGTTPTTATTNRPGNASIANEVVQCSSLVASSPNNCLPQVANGASIAKRLFNQPHSSGPETPPQSITCSATTTPQNVTPTGCTVITSERVMVSPCKHISYTVERNRCITSPLKPGFKRSGKRDCVKGRLDFGGSDEIMPRVDEEASTPESDKDENVFGLDLPDIFGPNFSFSDLMSDLDFGMEGFASCPCEPTSGASTDSASGTSQDGNTGGDQVFSEFCSSVTEVISGNDIQGSDAVTAVQSVTKSITILQTDPMGSQKQQD
ncbi:unnamed protein product, partial [Linum tenue]